MERRRRRSPSPERRRRGRSPSPERRRRGRSPSPIRRRRRDDSRRDDSPEHGEITRESEREIYLRRMRARERERDAQRRRSPSPERKRKRRSPSPDRRPRPSALVSQYDNLFAGADWYKGLGDAPPAQEGGEKGKPAAQERQDSPEAGEVEQGELPAPAAAAESVEELKHRLLFGFLSELGSEAEPAAAATSPPVASEPTVGNVEKGGAARTAPRIAASDAACTSSPADKTGAGCSCDGDGAAVARSCDMPGFTAGTGGPAAQTAAGKVAVNSASGGSCAACEACALLTAGTDGAMAREPCEPCEPHGRKRVRTGRRWRLGEMGVRHVVKTLRALALEQYAAAFVRHGVDGFMCDFLDDELLECQLGMYHPEHRQRFLQWVERRNVFDEMLQK
uniref:SAM domain-containing protein n=1 Tax=Calcidiscus leptoporus TaxID=127549 RepID=A0A7S0IZV1_9EUKA